MLNNLSKMAQLAIDKVKIWLIKDRQAWCTAVHGVTKSRTQLSNNNNSALPSSRLPLSLLSPPSPLAHAKPTYPALTCHLSHYPKKTPVTFPFPSVTVLTCLLYIILPKLLLSFCLNSKSGYRYFNHMNSIILYTSFSFSFFHSNF